MATTTLHNNAQQNGHQRTTTPIQPPTTAPLSQRDEFDSEAFEAQRESLPYLQLLNAQDPDQAGFFITTENMESVNFTPNEEWTPHTTTFQNGATVEGYRSLVARFLILHKSKLMMFDRDSGEFIGVYRKSQYDCSTMILKTRYLVYLISKDKRLLHETPLLLTAKGAFCGSFGETVEQFRNDMSKAYTAATGAKKPRGDRFMALSILAVRVQPELKGQTKKSWVCSVADYGVPTVENWKSFFIGYRPELKERILTQFDEWADFGNPEREFEAQAQRQPSPHSTQAETNQEHEENFDDFDYGYPEEI
ncbi:hypothetical protein C7B76_01135 [filamentous cyanobacterium CCP2]|nr:hypothetical protein C7B76_01135 [filamentous cyanobacterium CCP2]